MINEPVTDSVTELTGVAAMAILAAVPTAIALTLLLMWFYRRSALAEMKRHSGSGPVTNQVSRHELAAHLRPSLGRLRKNWIAGLTKYGISGLAYACLATLTSFAISETEFLPARTFVVATVFFWPFLLLMVWFFALNVRGAVLAVATYAAILLGVGLIFAANWYDPFVLWGMTNGPATALTLGFLWYRVRAVGHLALAFVLFAFLGAGVGMSWLSRHVGEMSQVGARFGASAEVIVMGVALGGALPAMAFGFALLRLLGSLYRKKQLSDQELLTDAIAFTFTLFLCLHLTFAGNSPGYFATGFLAFAGYYVTSRLLRPRLDEPALRAPRLLLLRVFGAPSAASKLWRAIGKGWRHVGTVCMISGPDLAASALEPHRFLDFLGRKLKDRFLRDSESLERALAALDEVPDADGKYPVNELYCWDDTWPAAFRAFADRCDLFLLDLRGFNQNRKGAAFELAQLASRRALSRTVLLIDGSTDETLVRDILANTLPADVPPKMFRVSGTRIPTMALTQVLIDAASPGAWSIPVAGGVPSRA